MIIIAYKVYSDGGHKVVSEDIILLGKFRHSLHLGNKLERSVDLQRI